jgi:hypothetical protein
VESMIRYSAGGRKAVIMLSRNTPHARGEFAVKNLSTALAATKYMPQRCYKITNQPHIKLLILIKILYWCGREETTVVGLTP